MLTVKVTGYNFNFARAIINLYTKHWAVSAEILASVFTQLKHYATVLMVCSNSTTIGAGPDLSTFHSAHSRPEL